MPGRTFLLHEATKTRSQTNELFVFFVPFVPS
jgi:hypothetical protein